MDRYVLFVTVFAVIIAGVGYLAYYLLQKEKQRKYVLRRG